MVLQHSTVPAARHRETYRETPLSVHFGGFKENEKSVKNKQN